MTFMKIYRESKRIIDHQNKQLIGADKQKTQFFRFASHELKSPIIAIKSTIDGVRKSYSGCLDEKATQLLSRASARSEQMISIIKELLELSRTRGNIQDVPLRAVDICQVLQEIVEFQQVVATEKQIHFETVYEVGSLKIVGNEDDFKKIFQNLIDNAIRYTPAGGSINIVTSLIDGQFYFRIKDSGIGIEEHDISKIFTEFYRSENAKKIVNFGTGLGLSLVKQVVEHYNGRINVKSKVNEGTQFTVILPAEKMEEKHGA